MTIITTPCTDPNISLNYAYSNRASLIIPDFNDVTFNIAEFDLPSLELPPVAANNPFSDDFLPGEKMEFGELSITFLVDGGYKNYQSIYKWMTGLGKPETYEQYRTKLHHRQDIKIILRDAHAAPTKEITFVQAWPTQISQIPFDFQISDAIPIKCNVVFAYNYFYVGESAI